MPDSVSEITILDGVAVLLIAGLGIAGAIKGAVRFVVGLAAVVAGVFVAARYGGALGAETWPVVRDLDDPQQVGTLLGCGLLFAATMIVGALVSRVMKKAVQVQDLGGLDRLAGFLFGVLRGALMAAVVTVAFMAAGVPALRDDAESSHSLRYTREIVEASRAWIPDNVRGMLTDVLELPDAAVDDQPPAEESGEG